MLSTRVGSLYNGSLLAQACKELCNCFPGLLTAAQTFPFEPDQADKFVAGIYRHNVVFTIALLITLVLHAVDQERLDVGLQVIQDGIATDEFSSTFQAEHRLHRARGTGIEGHHAVGDCAMKDIDHVHWNHQAIPLLIRHLEIRQQ